MTSITQFGPRYARLNKVHIIRECALHTSYSVPTLCGQSLTPHGDITLQPEGDMCGSCQNLYNKGER